MKHTRFLRLAVVMTLAAAALVIGASAVAPGLNLLTGTTQPFTFESGSSPFDSGSVSANPFPSDALNASSKALMRSTTGSGYPGTTYFLPSEAIPSARPVYVSFDYAKTYTPSGSETYADNSSTSVLWVLKNNGSCIADTQYIWKADGKWSHFGGFPPFDDTVTAGTDGKDHSSAGDPIRAIRLQGQCTAAFPGETKHYLDNISFIPSYRLAYHLNDGSEDDVLASEYFLFDDNGALLTSYDADLTKSASRYGYFFKGWSLSANGSPLTGDVYTATLANADIDLYALWEKDDDAPEPTEYVWDFEDADSCVWTTYPEKDAITYEYGLLNYDMGKQSSNFFIQLTNDVALDAKAHRYLVMKLANHSTQNRLLVYFRTSDHPSHSDEQTVQVAISPNTAAYTEYVVDLAQNALYTGNLNNFMIAPGGGSSNTGVISFEEIKLVTLYEPETSVKAYHYDLSSAGMIAGFGNITGAYEDGKIVMTRTAEGNGALYTYELGEGLVPVDDYPYLIYKVKTSEVNGVTGFNVYYQDESMSGFEATKNYFTQSAVSGDYTYFYVNFPAVYPGSAGHSYKRFMYTFSALASVKIEDICLAGDLILGDERLEKFGLYASADEITEDGGSVVLTPYARTESGTVVPASEFYYVTEGIGAALDVQDDGTAILHARLDGEMTVKAVYKADTSLTAAVTVLISGQSDRVVSQKIKWVSYGNSIHKHPPLAGSDWQVDWGMAASSEDKDYVHVLWKLLEGKYGEGRVEHVFGQGHSAFESGLAARDASFDYVTYLQGLEDFIRAEQPDIVTVQFGENIHENSATESGATVETYALGFEAFIDAVHRGAPDCIVLITKPFWGGSIRIAGVNRVAAERDCVVADLSKFNKDEYKALGLFTHPGVAGHPSDLGMQVIAEEMYEQLNIKLTNEFDKKIEYAVTPYEIGFANEDRAITEDSGTLDLAPYLLPVDAVQAFDFTSSDESVATVDENGVVTAFGNGTTTVMAVARFEPMLVATAEITVSGQLPPHNVFFDKNTTDAVSGMPETMTNVKGEKALPAVYPVRETYRFLGWSLSPDGAAVDRVTVSDDVTVYAIWEKALHWDFERADFKENFTVKDGFNQYVLDGHFMMIATDTNEAAGNILTVTSPAVDVDPAVYDTLVITMQNTAISASTTLRLTVNTTAGSTDFVQPVKSTAVETYEFDLSGLSGTVTGFSFKPTDMDTTIYLEDIAFMNSKEKPGVSDCVVIFGTNVRADLEINLYGHDDDAAAVLAVYGAEGRLVKALLVPLQGGIMNRTTVSAQTEEDVTAVKLFVFEDMTGLKPIKAAEVLYEKNKPLPGDTDIDVSVLL